MWQVSSPGRENCKREAVSANLARHGRLLFERRAFALDAAATRDTPQTFAQQLTMG